MTYVAPAEGGHGTNPYQRNLELLPFPEFGEGYLPGNVFVHFHFTPHRTAEQFDEARVLLAQADIFAAENSGWDAKRLRDANAVSKGDQRMLARLKQGHTGHINSEFANATLDGIYGTYKPVVFIDADDTQKHMVIGDYEQKYRRAVGQDIDSTLSGFADVLAVVAQAGYSRDLVMAHTMGPAVTKIASGHPKLSQKEQVNVLFLLGFGHRQVFNAFAQAPAISDRVSASIWANLYDADPESILVKRYKDGGSPTREEMEEFAITYALSRATIPAFSSRVLYNFNGVYKRNPDLHDVTGPIMVDLMKSMGQDGLALVHNVLRKSVTKEHTSLLLEIAQYARAQAAAQLGS